MEAYEHEEVERVLDEEDGLKLLSSIAKNIQDVTCLPISTVIKLCDFYKFDAERIINEFYVDKSAMMKKIGVEEIVEETEEEPIQEGVHGKKYECFCSHEGDGSEFWVLGCGHYFCKECLCETLQERLKDFSSGCACPMGAMCSWWMPPRVFEVVLSREEYEKFVGLMMRQFSKFENIKWCPNSNCNRAIYLRTPTTRDVKCICGEKFCFRCGEHTHQPATCGMMKLWKELTADEGNIANAKWLKVNTKACPGCGYPIEKNQGCLHMTCSHCRHEFCWLCLGEWKKHSSGFFQCNMQGHMSESELQKISQTKSELARWSFITERHDAFILTDAVKEKHTASLERKLATVGRHADLEWFNVRFLMDAVEKLQEIMNVLRCSYVCRYFLQEGPEKLLIDSQVKLERSFHLFSEFFMGPINPDDMLHELHRQTMDADSTMRAVTQCVVEMPEYINWSLVPREHRKTFL
eukprot:TRINITY_DN7208_c1_g1_i1.p1 TRINITY_DN7208_c1_g1~~TRINITY_DN7208_c1_g1_i1.p1  ORF type:complete len:465 (+),score=122.11 TRINITY_DN7208_c1_g1_i1:323-1717(+)